MSEFQHMFLIAVPQMGDPNFFHSVVFLMHHDAKGALGLVVNNPLDLSLGEFSSSQKIPCHEALLGLPVFAGGPVEPDSGWLLHSDPSIAERQEILPGLYVSRSTQSLGTLLFNGEKKFRLMLGYAGWEAGQLSQEMKEGAWITTEVNPKYILETEPAETWGVILSDMGVDPLRLALGTGFH
jgi:putative transcriptional regulator